MLFRVYILIETMTYIVSDEVAMNNILSLNNHFLEDIKDWMQNKGFFDTTKDLQMGSLNVVDKDKNLELQFAVPGFKKDELNISYNQENHILTIEGKREDMTEVSDKHSYKKEFLSENFVRNIRLDSTMECLDSHLENGILMVLTTKPKSLIKDDDKEEVQKIKIK